MAKQRQAIGRAKQTAARNRRLYRGTAKAARKQQRATQPTKRWF